MKVLHQIQMTKQTTPSILHISTHADFGGAARAGVRIAKSQHEHGVDSQLLCLSGHESITSDVVKKFEPATIKARLQVAQSFLERARKARGASLKNMSPSSDDTHGIPGFLCHINQSSRDIVNLHWINGLLSIEEIGAINKPIVWTLHDMWPFSGRQHLPSRGHWNLESPERDLCLATEDSCQDDALITKKLAHWQRPMTIVAPSVWLADCASKSQVMNRYPVCVIPNPVKTAFWVPVDRKLARLKMGLPQSQPLITFGGFNCITDSNKGFDLLRSAIQKITIDNIKPVLVVFGQEPPDQMALLDCPVIYVGAIDDDTELRLLYSATDVLAVPSRYEAFNQIASEAQSCGTPVVAFNNSGTADIIEHGVTGYLAHAFDTCDLAKGLQWLLCLPTPRLNELQRQARARAIRLFNYPHVTSLYIDLYQQVLEQSLNRNKAAF